MRAIDADALIAQMEADAEQMENTIFKMATYAAINDVKHQPTIEERKTGRWIEFPSHYAYKCSECGRVIETTDGRNNVYKHYPYCHCGCKMEVEND